MISLEATAERLREQRMLLIKKMTEGAKRRSTVVARSLGAHQSFRGSRRDLGVGDASPNTPRAAAQNPSREHHLERQLSHANKQLARMEEIQLRQAMHASRQGQPPAS